MALDDARVLRPTPLTPPVMSRLPLGLLGFLGVKNGGVYPQFLQNTVQSTWDLLELIAANHSKDETLTVPITALNLNVVAAGVPTVPQGEVWYVSQVGGLLTTAVGDTVTAAVVADQYFLTDYAQLAASQQNHWRQNARVPCFLPPGTFIGVMVDAIGGAPLPDATIIMRVARFPV
jgi:hypothetical protein